MNVFREDAGEALFDGVPAYKESKRIGYLPEERGLYGKRGVLEQLIYYGRLKGLDKKVSESEARAKLAEMEAEEYTNKKLETLSKGNQQKIQLAVAMLGDPDIIILDEPFSGLDPINAQVLKNAVRRQVDEGRTVIFSSHQMAQVEEFCDDICIIDKGHAVLEGNLTEIKRSYPRDLLYVEAEEGSLSKPLDTVLETLPYVVNFIPKGNGFLVKLSDPAIRSQLLRTLEEADERIDSFYVVEPSLEQIFVEKAGALDAAEEKHENTGDESDASKKDNRHWRARLFGRRAAK
jgi:ABC-2 type transport system ATP-binding protein